MDGLTCPGEDLGSFWYASCDSGGNVYFPADTNYSPIVIDAFGEGFHLTNVAEGVPFAIQPGRQPIQVAWTDAKFHNGWLVLDRNNNGRVDDSSEMFGNMTSQPKSDAPNGYSALAVFDVPENGSNGNGVIDAGDEVFTKLRVWIDQNHNGISEPNELHTLDELSITGIDLKYVESPTTDQFGNAFRYLSTLSDAKKRSDHKTYDVYLQILRPH